MKYWFYITITILLFYGCNKDDLSSFNNKKLVDVGKTDLYNLKPKSMFVSNDNAIVVVYHSNDSITNKVSINIKMYDFNGNLISETRDLRMKYGFCITQTNDGGYIVTGENEDKNACLLKIDSNLKNQWFKTYNYGYAESYGINVIQNQDGEYFLLVDKEIEDYRLLKTNSVGDTLWTKSYSSWTMDLPSIDLKSLKIRDFKIQDDKIFLIGNCIIQTDMNGNIEWYKKMYPNISEEGVLDNSVQMIDKNIYCLGALGNSIYLIKITINGNILWNKSILTGYNIESTNIEKTNDLNFVFATTDFSLDQYQTRIQKLNQDGDIIWDFQPEVNDQYERIISIKQLNKDYYVSLYSIIGDDYLSKKLVLYRFKK